MPGGSLLSIFHSYSTGIFAIKAGAIAAGSGTFWHAERHMATRTTAMINAKSFFIFYLLDRCGYLLFRD